MLRASAQLTEQNAHEQAVACFRMLYKLIEKMENGEDIVFAHELGSWMIPCQEKDMLAAYIASLAATASPEAFAIEVAPLARRDSFDSFANRVYTAANRAGSKEQKAQLRAELKRQYIPTGPQSKRTGFPPREN